jgi:hypothetical protein
MFSVLFVFLVRGQGQKHIVIDTLESKLRRKEAEERTADDEQNKQARITWESSE